MKETKEIITLVCSLIKATEKSYKDGEFSWGDLVHFKDVIHKIGPGIIGYDEVMEELKNMTVEQKKELVEYAQKEFDLENDRVELIVENIFLAVLYIAYTYKVIRESREEKK